jgi:glycine/D-amino acid oxidase-like deaminating enzyme
MSSHRPDGDNAVGISLWKAINPPAPAAVPLQGKRSTDVLIVGAGIAGLSLGLHLGGKQTDTVILEASDDANEATSASAGIVAPQLVRNTPGSVLETLGEEVGAPLLRMIAASGRLTFDLIKRFDIECGARQSGFLNPVSGQHAAQAHERLTQEWRAFRNDLRLIDGAEVRALSGCRGYSAGIIDPTGGSLDPLAYSRGLARAARSNGVTLHYGSRVLSLSRVGNSWLARTASGAVNARRVVLCANGGNRGLHPALARTILPLPVYEVATRPLPPAMREKILPQDHALTDSSTDVFSIRFDTAGRLITAYPGGRRRVDAAQLDPLVNRRLESMIPDYRATALEYVWHGTAWLNSSLLPRVSLVEDGLMAVQACNGRGIAMNTIIGRELAQWIADPTAGLPGVPLEAPRRVAGFAFARYLPELMIGGAALAKRTLERLGWRT